MNFRRPIFMLLPLALVRTLSLATEFDLSRLPAYVSETANVHGVVRIHDSELTQPLVHRWQDQFLKLHPLVRYKESTVPAWFNGLCAGTADLAFAGRRAYRTELVAFERTFGYPVTEIVFATGGFNQRKGNTPGVIVFVNRENPLTGLTLEQLDGIFGAERSGGWEGTRWTAAVARGPEKNIRLWGQLGLGDEWTTAPISLYGIDATLSGWSALIQQVVFHGGTKWNPALHEIVRGGTEVPADDQIVAGVAGNRRAIGFSFMRVVEKNPGVKPLAIASNTSSPFIPPTAQSFFARTYPLVTSLFIYLNRPPGQPLPPRLREFLRFILSREGQQAVVDDGMYIPLNADAVREQRILLQ